MEPDRMSHDALIIRAQRWLYNTVHCGYVATEVVCGFETPDALGFRSTFSVLIECKTSRSDFRADFKKFARKYPQNGLGNYRFYMTEPGLLQPQELPEHWGLLEVHNKQVRIQTRATGWGKGNVHKKPAFYGEEVLKAERRVMYSVLRRQEDSDG